MAQVQRAPDGSLRVALEEYEAELLRRLADEMRLLLEADIPQQVAVMQRLFPAAYEESEDEASYRAMIDDELREAKASALTAVSEGVGTEGGAEVVLSRTDVDSWLTFLTDTRLAIGTRLGVDEETMAREVDPSDPGAVSLSVLHWLAYVQELLLEPLTEDR